MVSGPHRGGYRRDRVAAAPGLERADLGLVIGTRGGVVERLAVWAPARRAGPFAQPGERLDARLARRLHLGAQPGGVLSLRLAELLVEIEVGLAEHPVRAEVEAEGNRARPVVVRQVPQRAEPVLVADPFEEPR